MATTADRHDPRAGNGVLADPGAQTTGVTRAFKSDPGLSEAWWWLGIPLTLAVSVLAIYAVAPRFYKHWILPEGYGVLELSQFLISTANFLFAVWLLRKPFVRRRRLVFWFLILSAAACFYIAGEEQSWGQHFFGWQTPDYWAQINRQHETNLHNVLGVFDSLPRSLLESGVIVGGLIIPAAALLFPWFRRSRFALFLPAGAMVPAALGAVLFKSIAMVQSAGFLGALLLRPSETTEAFMYLFILFYLIVFARRIAELEADQTPPS